MSWVFRVTEGAQAGRRFECRGERFLLVGCDLHAHIRLRGDDPYISGVHCLLEALPSRLLVRDLESTNGTLVNGRRVRYAELKDGDEIRLGRTTLKVEWVEGGTQPRFESPVGAS
ncbi:MAG: FHA domain-containing protein [Deltaproteobacteria bacterium]|nr:FHA domain-containing protein [Deltaproteobacteria bacterium]